MVMVLQDEIRRSRASCSLELSFMSDLTLVREIGRGGFGTVYSGFWRKMPAAIKAMHARVDDGEAVSDAMEIAVLSNASASASFCCPDAAEAQPPPRFHAHAAGRGRGSRAAGSYNLIVMELCDRGSLRDAVRRGAFHRRVRHDEALSVDADSVVEVLLDVASSLQYLHDRANLVHGDVKLDNVLLKSDASTPLGFVPKLSDFGLTKVLSPDARRRVINLVGAGTVTHLAPELLIRGSEITPAVDVFSFGILMFELFAATQPYAGLSRDAIIAGVLHRDLRPTFPPGTPPPFAALAAACWARAPAARPGFAEVILALRQMRGRPLPAPRPAPRPAPLLAPLPVAAPMPT
ncbi:MAG: kinase-like domain-containing protein [Monoraphidium minutum]|nr:MAG: kinase-like domain-containing protein [Monoraphidium minutum]